MLKIAWSSDYVLPLPPNHRFPMSKYEALPQQLVHEGTVAEDQFFAPPPMTEEMICRVHDADYWRRLSALALTPKEVRRTGFPLSRQLVDREVRIAQGTLMCTAFALEFGVAMNIAGGTHHAFTNRGEGFCLLNDIALAARHLLDQSLARKILVVDLDVHQGNGTAEIFLDEPRVFTFSMHGANNYPMVKETSDLDVPLPDQTPDHVYLHVLDARLKEILDRFQPDFIFYQSGVDVLGVDRLGRLNLTHDGCRARDRMVFELARRNKIPLVAAMGGGYARDFWDIIEAHANTFRLAQDIFF